MKKKSGRKKKTVSKTVEDVDLLDDMVDIDDVQLEENLNERQIAGDGEAEDSTS